MVHSVYPIHREDYYKQFILIPGRRVVEMDLIAIWHETRHCLSSSRDFEWVLPPPLLSYKEKETEEEREGKRSEVEVYHELKKERKREEEKFFDGKIERDREDCGKLFQAAGVRITAHLAAGSCVPFLRLFSTLWLPEGPPCSISRELSPRKQVSGPTARTKEALLAFNTLLHYYIIFNLLSFSS